MNAMGRAHLKTGLALMLGVTRTDRLLDKKMAPLPLVEAISAVAVTLACPSWTRRVLLVHRTCQTTSVSRSSSYIDT